ncbi:unnamed protein product, partial [Prorocentrum cordatum]
AAPPLASLPLARGRPSPSRGPPQGPVRPLAGPAPIGGPRASSALPTDGRRGCVPHGPAPERRNGRSPRSECVRPVRRAGAGGRRDLHARRRGLAPHGPAPERRHGRGLRPECGRPVRRAGAGGRRDLHARRRGWALHSPVPERRHGRSLRPECARPVRRAGAGGRRDLHARRRGLAPHGPAPEPTARSQPSARMSTASATCQRWREAWFTRTPPRVLTTRSCSGATARSRPAARMRTASATCRRWREA